MDANSKHACPTATRERRSLSRFIVHGSCWVKPCAQRTYSTALAFARSRIARCSRFARAALLTFDAACVLGYYRVT